MGMMNCNDCGQSISSTAQKCPHCGSMTPNRSQNTIAAIGAVILILIALAIGVAMFLRVR